MTRLSTSRPMSSVTKGCARRGAERRISGWVASGSYGARTGANTAVSTITTRSAAATAPRGFRFIVSHSSCPRLMVVVSTASKVATGTGTAAINGSRVADARVKPRVGQIHDQVQRDQRRGDEHHVGLHDRIVAIEDRLDSKPPHPRQGEDRLHDDRAGEQRPELAADDRDDGDERGLQCVR